MCNPRALFSNVDIPSHIHYMRIIRPYEGHLTENNAESSQD